MIKDNQEALNSKQIIRFRAYWIWYLLSIIFFISAIFYLSQANDYLDGSAQIMGASYSKMYEKFVNGDAYNYIIAGTYSTTITLRALIFCILGISSIFLGKISSLKEGEK